MDKGSHNKSRKIQIMISDSLNNQLSQASDRCGITKSAFVRVALEREFARDKQLELECAGHDLAHLYGASQDLTSFIALDGEELLLFYNKAKKVSSGT